MSPHLIPVLVVAQLSASTVWAPSRAAATATFNGDPPGWSRREPSGRRTTSTRASPTTSRGEDIVTSQLSKSTEE
jgi:hypothetical protein